MGFLDRLVQDLDIQDNGPQLTNFKRETYWPDAYVSYAYSPRERSGTTGGYHIVTNTELVDGRLVRLSGHALCKTSFWGLNPVGHKPTCERCKTIAARNNLIVWKDATDYMEQQRAMNDYMAIG